MKKEEIKEVATQDLKDRLEKMETEYRQLKINQSI